MRYAISTGTDSPAAAGYIGRAARYCTLAAAVAPLFSVAASAILLGASFLLLLLSRERLRFPPIRLPLALFFTGTVVSLLLSGDVVSGLPHVRKFYVVLLALVTVSTGLRGASDALKLVELWIAAATCAAAMGLVQFGHRLLNAIRSGEDLYRQLVGDRITGFMSLWMTFSGELTIVLMFAAAYVLFGGMGRKRILPATVCALVIATALVLALTRGPWIGAAAGGIFLLWRWKRKSLLAVPVIGGILLLAAPGPLRDRVVSVAQPRSERDSNAHRVVLWRTGMEIIKAHPWFGIGPEQVRVQFDAWVPPSIPRPLPWGWYGHLHNIYLQYAAERGIPTLMALLWLVLKVLHDFLRAARAQPPGAGKAVLEGSTAAVIAVLVAGLFEHNLGDSEILQMFLSSIALGYVCAQRGVSRVLAHE